MRFPDDVPVLTDGVVTLRAHVDDDVDAVVEQCTDPQSIAWTTVPVPYERNDAREFVGTIVPDGWRTGASLGFAIEYAGRFAGSIDLRPRDAPTAEIGFGLHPGARGRGVMTRALGLVLDWAFAERGHSVVMWRANVGNWASRRAAWHVGFHFGPTIPRLLEQRGTRYDGWTGWITPEDSRQPKNRWLEVPVLESANLRLRPWREDDRDCLVETSNDERLRRFIPHSPLPRAQEQVTAYVQRVHQMAAEGLRMSWAVARLGTDEAIGNVAVFDFEPDGSAQLGYWTRPRARGGGMLSEAARTAADWALAPRGQGLGLRRLYLLCAASNAASRRVAEQAGFCHVGTERQAAPVGDGFDDTAVHDRLA